MLGRSRSSLTASSSVGTTLLAGQHLIPLLTFGLYSMFPCLISRFTYVCAVASSFSLLIASFANSVALLILFQGILLGIFGGNLFTTVILWLPDWWDETRFRNSTHLRRFCHRRHSLAYHLHSSSRTNLVSMDTTHRRTHPTHRSHLPIRKGLHLPQRFRYRPLVLELICLIAV